MVELQVANGGAGPALGTGGLGEGWLARAPQHGLQAGLQFLHVEGFGEVIVRPGVEAAHAVVNAITGGEDEHGQAHNAGARPGQQVQSVSIGQAQVQNDSVHGLVLQNRHALRHAGCRANAVIQLLELPGEGVLQQCVVFDDQYRGHGFEHSKAPASAS